MSQSDFVSRGQALVAAGQYQEAVKVCRLGLLGRPTTVDGRVVLGQALLALKRFDEVLAEMRVALELDASSIPAQILRGEALLKKGDHAAAAEALQKARQASPGDQRILQLLGQTEQKSGKPPISASHPSVGFVGGDTKHYPGAEGDEDSGGGYTRPTSVSEGAGAKKSAERPVARPVQEKTGTVEVDPELDGVEMPEEEDDDEADELAPPPPAKPQKRRIAKGDPTPDRPERGGKVNKVSTPTMDLDIGDLEVDETRSKQHAALPRGSRVKLPGLTLEEIEDRRSRPLPGGTALRKAVGLASGPIDGPQNDPPPSRDKGKTLPPPVRLNSKPPTMPPPLANAPYVPSIVPPSALAQTQLPPAQLLPPGTPQQRLNAALPTVAAMPPPPVPPAPSPANYAAAAQKTVAIAPPPEHAPSWNATAMPAAPLTGAGVAAPFEPTARPGELLDPRIAAMIAAGPPAAPPQPQPPPPQAMPSAQVILPQSAVELPAIPPQQRSSVRRTRSKAQIAMWVVIGGIVIGGGVFAGFQIRAMRLQKHIGAARDRATDLAKADTYSGWTAAFSSLGDIANASDTIENRAALARARATIAFEFGDDLAGAKAAVDALAGQGGHDGELAAAYVALAQGDAKASKIAADAALASASQEPASLRVAGEAALLAGDPKSAITYLKEAYGKDARPFYGIALARAQAASYAWDDAMATLDRVLQAWADHPGALIARADLLSDAGRIAPGQQLGMEVKAQLEKVVAEGNQPVAKQTRGISPAQAAEAELALAKVNLARNDPTTARGDLRAAVGLGVDEQRFAEDWVDTLYTVGELTAARAAAERTLTFFPTSRRTRISLAQILIATGHPQEADDALAKQGDVLALPLAMSVRAAARASDGDSEGARADFDAALKKLPNLEPALVGRAWLEIGAGNLDEAKKLVEPRIVPAGTPPAVATVYAAVLRRGGDAASREKAKSMLEKVVNGPPGPDSSRAQLELARLYAESGDAKGARAAYAEAIKTGNFDAKLENAELLIDDGDPQGGRETLEGLLKDSGLHPRADLVLEVARARMLVGIHDGARALLESVEKLPNVVKWKLDREKGRLALRKGDIAGAASALSRALDGCGSDVETFLLAADTATADEKQAAGLSGKIQGLLSQRLKDMPEGKIVSGKLALAAEKYADALAMFTDAKTALDTAQATKRRRAQAHFGIAVAKYFQRFDAEAADELQLVMVLDPSLYSAYLFRATLIQQKKPKESLELAHKAGQLDPDSVDAWALTGQLAGKLGDKKLLAEAIAKLGAIAPTSDQLKQLQQIKR